MAEKPSLHEYLRRYAQGGIPREEMIATIAAWDFEEEIHDDLVIESTGQDNVFAVVNGAALLGTITDDDLDEIVRRKHARG
ncbi:hypothetical protein I3215_19330 [Streptomyces sp. RB110-1]|uniref:hypothetical protein n=1 Tax=unclassified Streptomyces TaxID=2593676 RepID=UPI0019005853|nr:MULTISPECIES: hypothetical protein [unclassified Streptomyces]MBK0375029.1 hypothetical protein [Streptomyces sp. RB110-1]MBK0388601.1 hypothetical protein [Streptomyces sp. RB110-2]